MASLPPSKRKELLSELSEAEAHAILHSWEWWARPDQRIPPGDKWDTWLAMAGRGWGKTRVGAETVRRWVNDGTYKLLHFVARTAADVRDTMIEGESGLLAVCAGDTGNVPTYEPSKRRVTWPNGAKALTFSAEKPDALRGPQCEAYWADELAAWQYREEAWDQLMFGARLGSHVRGIVTTTPRPVPELKALLADEGTHVVVTRGSTYDNASNLSRTALSHFRRKYEGTQLGRQELYGELVEDVEGALWTRDLIDRSRILSEKITDLLGRLSRIVVGVDPSGSSGATGDEIGIVTCGRDANKHGYVLSDETLLAGPQKWAETAVMEYHRWNADAIVVERNFGGAMATHTIKQIEPSARIIEVTASRGKAVRAEPVVAMYEQGRIHHCGHFAGLEDEQCGWVPGESRYSPNHIDALVWGMTELLIDRNEFWTW